APAQLRLRFLKQQIVCTPVLLVIGPNSRCIDQTTVSAGSRADDQVRQRSRLRNGLGRNPPRLVGLLPGIRETELVGPAWRKGVLIGEEKILVLGRSIEDETGKKYGDGRVGAGVTNVAKRQAVRFREVVIQPQRPLRPSIGLGESERRR